ncbi:MAG: hypothetical protein QF570_20435 [Myxococcota bacterium]|nr:hypothetical protein [Myxococcota bacterium]
MGAVRSATVGALQALAVMAAFVMFGLGWALVAEALPTAQPAWQSTAQVSDAAIAPAGHLDLSGPAGYRGGAHDHRLPAKPR